MLLFGKARCWHVVILGFLGLASPGPAAATDDVLLLRNGFATLTLSVNTTPALRAPWQLQSNSQGERTYVADVYRLNVKQSVDSSDRFEWQLTRTDDAGFHLKSYSVAIAVPATTSAVIVSPNHVPTAEQGLIQSRVPQAFEERASAHRGVPFIQMVGEEGATRHAVGWLDQAWPTRIAGEMRGAQFRVSLTKQVDRKLHRAGDSVFYSSSPATWFATARTYARWVDGQRDEPLCPIPAAAYQPAYDCWYFTQDDIDQTRTLGFAKECARLGLVNYLLDSGWDTDTGEYTRQMVGRTGDYRPPANRFPNFNGMLSTMGGMQLNPILWLQPFILGRAASAYPAMKDSLVRVTSHRGGTYEKGFLCPRDPKTRLYLRQLFERVMDDYRPAGGVWIDAVELMPDQCHARHPHDREFGPALQSCLKTIREVVRARVPDALIQLRSPYTNLHNKPFANTWQPVDHPGDFHGMRLLALAMRPFSEGVAMATDEQYWRESWSDPAVGRCLASVMLSGAPALSFDPSRVPASHIRIVRAWLGFYQQHREALSRGDFTPFGSLRCPAQKIEQGDRAYVLVPDPSSANHIPLASPREAYLVNITEREQTNWTITGLRTGPYRVTVCDRELQEIAGTTQRTSGRLILRAPVPVGGMVKLEHLEARDRLARRL